MKTRSCAAMCIAAASLFATLAKAQCPGGLTNPLNLIDGTSWAFQTEDGLSGDATIGIFTAKVAPNPRTPSVLTGVLNITETFNNAGSIQEQVAGSGGYQVNPDCSGGMLFLPGPFNGYQYAFVFAANRTKMLLVTSNPSIPNNGLGASFAGNRGRAVLMAGPPSCAGVINPLSLLVGTWSFLAEDYQSAVVGMFNAQVQPSTRTPSITIGALNVTETTSGAGLVNQVQASVTGVYEVYPDCSGGRLLFSSGAANSYAFFFAGPSEIYMVSNSLNGPSNTTFGAFRANHGQAIKF